VLCAAAAVLQDYIDSMEGATLSGRQCAAVVLKAAPQLAGSAAAAAAKQQEKQPVAA
jgi:zeta-carotene desaturase